MTPVAVFAPGAWDRGHGSCFDARTVLTAITLLTSIASAPCGAPLFMPELPPPPARSIRPFGVGTLAERDQYGVPGVVTNEALAVRYGPDASEAQANLLLGDLTAAWTQQVDEMGWPSPPTSDEFKFNVYVGDSGGNTPDSFGNSGYFWTDDEGYPMLVVALATVQDDAFRPWVAAHELNHALQYAFTGYTYDGEAAWAFEATAEWAASVVHPDNDYHGSTLGPYAMLPHLGVTFFDYPDENLLQEWHQYGAIVFLRYLSENVIDDDGIRRAWAEPDPDNEPLLALFREVEATGADPAEVFADYAANNVAWEYEQHELYAYWSGAWVEFYPAEDARVAGPIPVTDDEVPVDAPADLAPERFAYNLLSREVPARGTWRFTVDGAEVRARVVIQTGGAIEHVDVNGPTDVALEEGDVVTLAVAAIGLSNDPRDRFPYRAGMTLLTTDGPDGRDDGDDDLDDDLDDAEPPASGLGCASTGVDPSLLALLSAVCGVRRRRARAG